MIAPSTNAAAELVNVQLDGQWVQVPKGMNAIEAARGFGKFIPHYCYHPKLEVVGNCRMCLIEIGTPKMGPDRKPVMGADGRPEILWMPRPQIGCATKVSDGMGIRTTSPLVEECRKGVMEFLLLNHPLDCPICDQAGECKLQEFSVEYGNGGSRFVEKKVTKPKRVDIGRNIILDDERCILCSRCIRFMRDVAKDDCLGFTQRGSHTTLSIHPGKRLDSNYSLNTVDICPVGALTSKDFRFKMRVWFLKETPSICATCGTGCNTIIGSREGVVYRQTPRENGAVNECWMCDRGRLNFHFLHDPARLTQPLLHGKAASREDALDALATALKNAAPPKIAILASARMTNEELYLVRRLRGRLGGASVKVATVPRPQEADGLLVCGDGNSNTAGARLMGIPTGGEELAGLAEGAKAGAFDVIVALGEDLAACGVPEEALRKAGCVAAVALLPNGTTASAGVVLPGAGFAEKRGTMVNVKGRIQRLNKAIPVPGGAADDWEILAGLLGRLGDDKAFPSIDAVFAAMAAEAPAFHGLTMARVGDGGLQLEAAEAA